MSIYRNRFERNKKNPFTGLPMLLSLAAFCILFCLFFNGVHSVSASSIEKQKEGLINALQRSITQCYAVEGAYPQSLDYLKEHYGLTYDESLFYVDYQPIGTNIMPDFTILQKKGGSQ